MAKMQRCKDAELQIISQAIKYITTSLPKPADIKCTSKQSKKKQCKRVSSIKGIANSTDVNSYVSITFFICT
jgi:hypothetical protein